MRYTRLGDTGLVVSRLAFGAMTFGSGDLPAVYKVDARGAAELVGMALDAGINFFDTADAYAAGQSEEMLGKALAGKRGDAVVCTKVGMRVGGALTASGLSRRHILHSVDGSLRRLGTDWIDVYIVHRPDPMTPLEETLEALDHVVRAGKVRYLGFSNWPAWLAAKAVGLQRRQGLARFVVGQMYYSLVGRDVEHEVVPFALDAGVGLMVWSPLASGFLSGKYTRRDPTGGGGRLTGFDFIPFDRERGYDIVEVQTRIAQRQGSTPAAVALAWLTTRPAVATVLVGASSASQLAANLSATEISLTEADVNALDEASRPAAIYPGWFNEKIVDRPLIEALATT